ncbi:ISAon1 family transposase N-terminal region protein [Dyadobacter bucti]|uniref:ISAon1 family transposase N-terminal region protein n=1 Tax=Dyadobacter bucti TaxID=2572203 RepID=UPI003F6EB142
MFIGRKELFRRLIRAHNVFLHVKRRRWLATTTGKVVHRDWNEVAEGTWMTSELSAYLKEIGGYEG